MKINYKEGDIVKLKTCEKVESKADLWEVTLIVNPFTVKIRNVEDYEMDNRVQSFTWDVSLIQKVK